LNLLEIIAALLSLLAVWLAVKPYMANWPAAMLGTALYLYLFWENRLYSDMVLQLVFLVMQGYGWAKWTKGNTEKPLNIGRMLPSQLLISGIFTLVAWVGWTLLLLKIKPDASMPWLDSFTAALSVLAICMQAWKKIENWLVWMLADLIYIPLYLKAEMPVTALLYAIFLLIAFLGWRRWKSLCAG
jgi:nicotinamide mononucleotide transporter